MFPSTSLAIKSFQTMFHMWHYKVIWTPAPCLWLMLCKCLGFTQLYPWRDDLYIYITLKTNLRLFLVGFFLANFCCLQRADGHETLGSRSHLLPWVSRGDEPEMVKNSTGCAHCGWVTKCLKMNKYTDTEHWSTATYSNRWEAKIKI